MPTKTQRDTGPQNPILSAVHESQTALVDVVRSWTDFTGQLTRSLPQPTGGIDVAGAVDRAFDLAEQTLAAQRQFVLSLVGVVDRQVDTALETVGSTASESLRGVEVLVREAQSELPAPAARVEELKTEARKPAANEAAKQAAKDAKQDAKDAKQAAKADAKQAAKRDAKADAKADAKQDAKQDAKVDRRPFGERTVEELRDRASELEIEGRSAMSKDELIAALRQHAK